MPSIAWPAAAPAATAAAAKSAHFDSAFAPFAFLFAPAFVASLTTFPPACLAVGSLPLIAFKIPGSTGETLVFGDHRLQSRLQLTVVRY